MKPRTARTLFLVSSLALSTAWMVGRFNVSAESPRAAQATSVAKAAKAFLDSLDAASRAKAQFAFDDAERTNWHFIPRGRRGLALLEIAPYQRELALGLLEASLGGTGFQRAQDIRYLEGLLREKEGQGRRFPRETELYFVSIFGEPGATGRWAWRFEGHHISANFAFVDGQFVAATPLAIGANPAKVLDGPRAGLRVCAEMEDAARELIRSFDAQQLAACLGEGDPEELKGMEKATYDDPLPSGVRIDTFTEAQGQILERLANSFVENIPESVREAMGAEAHAAGIESVQFAWRGGREPGQGHSYILWGPTFIASYANFQNDAKHVHAALRSRKGEFGN